MAKAKGKKRGLAQLTLKKKTTFKARNPFEVQVNKQKFVVLGRKSKNDRGLPGVARAKSIKKRKETLLQEYKVKDKANKFVDRRIGERNSAMTREDKIMARFAAEKMKAHNKKTQYNLASDEILTHRGRCLAEVDKFDDPRSDDEDEMDLPSSGALSANFVSEAHFGGGVLKKKNGSRLSVIEELIADSKRRKVESQQAREKTLELTDKLDQDWKELLPMLEIGKPPESDTPNRDPYDLLMNQLIFDPRGKPSERLKSEEEIVAEEAKKLKELEAERLRRMEGSEHEQQTYTQHKSADDLEDGFQIEDEQFSLVYDKDGVLIGTPPPSYVPKKTYDEMGEEGDESGEEGEESGEEEEESGEEGEESEEEEEGVSGEDEEVSGEEEEANGGEKDLSGEKGKESRDEEENDSCSVEEVEKEETEEVLKSKVIKGGVEGEGTEDEEGSEGAEDEEGSEEEEDVSVEEINEKNSNQKEVVGLLKPNSKTSKKKEDLTSGKVTVTGMGGNQLNQSTQLAYTYKVPERYEDLVELFKGRSPAEVGLIIERMIKCNHVSLAEHNRAKLLSLYGYLIRFISDTPLEDIWNIIEHLKLRLLELMHFSPKESADILKDIINKHYETFMKQKQKFPDYKSYYLIKLVEILYPTSDKFHSVSSIALLYMCQVLSRAPLTSRRGIASALFLVTQMANYVSDSKRVSTEAVSRLAEILELATPNPTESSPQKGGKLKLLYLQQAHTSLSGESLKMQQSDLGKKCGKVDDDFRVRSVHITISLVGIFISLYEDIPGATLYFHPFRALINRIEVSKYPCETVKLFEKVKGQLEQLTEKEVDCQPPAPKVKTKLLRLFEPRIEPVYEGKRRKDGGVEGKAELDKLVHKVRSEKKGALREIRRDNAFIAKLKITQQAANDADRVRRVNQIYGWAAQQQGDINKIKRSKKK